MNTSSFRDAAITFCASAILLTACDGPQTVTARSGQLIPSRIGVHGARSWIRPTASGQDLLYISSNDLGNVYVYTYPQGQLVGTLTGFIYPYGDCSDAAGDVFVVAYTAPSMKSSTIYEYAHGGTSPIATLSDPNVAVSCAVDPGTGNLAVAGNGVAVYQHATGNPTIYSSAEFHFYNCAYGNRGILYLSATNGHYGNQAQLVRLAKSSGNFEQISLSPKLYSGTQWPSVQWHGGHLTVTSNPFEKPITVYQLKVARNSATVVATTTLSDKRNNYYVGQTWIQGHTVVGLGFFKRDYQNAYFWRYPRGGEPKGGVRKVGGVKQYLWGVTVSVAPPQKLL